MDLLLVYFSLFYILLSPNCYLMLTNEILIGLLIDNPFTWIKHALMIRRILEVRSLERKVHKMSDMSQVSRQKQFYFNFTKKEKLLLIKRFI